MNVMNREAFVLFLFSNPQIFHTFAPQAQPKPTKASTHGDADATPAHGTIPTPQPLPRLGSTEAIPPTNT